MQFITKIVKAKKPLPNPQDITVFENLIKDFSPPKPNTMVSSVVRDVEMESDGKGFVYLANGGKTDACVPIEEVWLGGHGMIPKVGDKIQIYYINNNSSSFAAGAQTRSWSALERNYKELAPVSGTIVRRAKKRSGFIVAILPYGARAFLSLSKANMSLIESRGENAVFMFRIIKMDLKSLHIGVSMGEGEENS